MMLVKLNYLKFFYFQLLIIFTKILNYHCPPLKAPFSFKEKTPKFTLFHLVQKMKKLSFELLLKNSQKAPLINLLLNNFYSSKLNLLILRHFIGKNDSFFLPLKAILHFLLSKKNFLLLLFLHFDLNFNSNSNFYSCFNSFFFFKLNYFIFFS
jgi:hypothetical protein